ncbi:MAG TPA: hypothetical protein PKA64_16020, partial [Myxococcota bacterium]|nr:hypothetical protein [Myxococcota bacterium]
LADGALTPDDIADMATRTWVTAAYPEQAEHDALAAQVAALADGALTPDDIADMATRTWVAAQGYATTSYADAGDDADRAWVLAQGYATSAEVASLGERLDDLGVDVDTLDAWLTGLDADLSAHDRRLDGLDADADSIWSALTEQQLALGKTLGVISEDLTVHVRPGATAGDASWTYGTIGAALRALDAWWISPSARVTIQVDDGVYDEGELRISHANGDRILIVGDPGDPDRVELRFQGTGLHLTDASALGGIDGVHLVGGTEGHAFEVSNNASLEIGGAVKTTGFANAVFAHDGGFVGISFGEPLLFADHPSYAGVNAENGAVVRAKGAAGADRPGGLRVDGGVYGIRAMMASSIDASYAYVTNASYEGIRGSVGSAIIANGSWVEGATDALGQAGLQGVVSGEVSVVVFDSGRVRGTGDVGLLAGDGGALLAQGAWSWDNASDDLRADSAAYVMFHAGGTPLDDVLIDATRPGDHALAFTQPDIYADARGYVSATSVSWTEPEGNTAEVDYLGAINLRGSTPNAACTPAKVPGEAGQPNAQPGHIVY